MQIKAIALSANHGLEVSPNHNFSCNKLQSYETQETEEWIGNASWKGKVLSSFWLSWATAFCICSLISYNNVKFFDSFPPSPILLEIGGI